MSIVKFEASLNISPFELFSRIHPEEGWIFFDTSLQNVPYSNYSIICIKPKIIVSFDGNKFTIRDQQKVENVTSTEPLKFLRELFLKLKNDYTSEVVSNTFTSGFAGYFSYDFGMKIEKVGSKNPSSTNLPEIFLAFFENVLVFNHSTKKYEVYSYNSPKEFLDFIFRRLETPKKPLQQNFKIEFKSNFSKEEYLKTIERVKKYIEEGDVYQINLSQQFQCNVNLHPIEIYSRLRERNPAQFSALICVNQNQWILSSSPELFIDLKGKKVITKPIKGTIRRGKNSDEDEELKNQLLNSEKDSAELLMIVDLERNDFGKIARAGSVKVNSLKRVETYASVHHLVAEIESELMNDKDIFDLIEAMFPGGSITGAPKKRAMEIIDELEKTKRGVYTGSIGYIDLNGNSMFNIAIRTLIYENGKLFLNLGGGIVYDSNPEKEFDETLQKGKAIFQSLLGDILETD
ncbi:MAG: aminodeoxychorismate synthase component I [Ignavibacteria bacterium]|nr:aminodeoxychorismate synthase component I [Ignavibacteria bacterium]